MNHAIGTFLQSWIDFEKSVRAKLDSQVATPLSHLLQRFRFQNDQALGFEVERIRRIRNNLVHGIEMPDAETLASAASRLDQITAVIKKKSFKFKRT